MDEDAYPGKPVVKPTKHEDLTDEQKKMAFEAVNLVKESGTESSKDAHAHIAVKNENI